MPAKDKSPEIPTSNLLLWTEDQAASHLNICARTLRQFRLGGKVPFLKLNSSVRYSPAALAEWIAKNQGKTVEA